MEKSEKLELFSAELNYIHSHRVKVLCEKLLCQIPEYFFVVAASSTGKYHPKFALGPGGLVRHTKAAVRMAKSLFRIMNLTELEEDAVITALIFHDSLKHGQDGGKYTVANHPVLAHDMLEEYGNEYAERFEKYCAEQNQEVDFDFRSFTKLVASLILTHMGQWNTDYRTRKVLMPKPSSSLQNFTHLCDYLASRKFLEFDFDIEVDNG